MTSSPSGQSCSTGSSPVKNFNGALFSCQAGVYAAVTGGGGSGVVTPTFTGAAKATNGSNTLTQSASSDLSDSFSLIGQWKSYGTALTWNNHPQIAAEQQTILEPSVIYEGSPIILTSLTNVFKMWYTYGWSTNQIGYAESPDGIVWTKYSSNPVWAGHFRSSIIKSGGTYYLYGANQAQNAIDLITSTDGVNFSGTHTGVITPGAGGAWDNTLLYNTSVIIDAGTWYMLYEANGVPEKIGLATSADGINWTKYVSNPVITAPGSVQGPMLRKIGSTYYCWLGRSSNTTFFPTDLYRYSSPDLHTWTSTANPTYARVDTDEGATFPNGQVADAFVLEVNGQSYLWYTAIIQDGNLQSSHQHIKVAIAPTTLANLVTTNEGRYATNNAYAAMGENQDITSVASGFTILNPYGAAANGYISASTGKTSSLQFDDTVNGAGTAGFTVGHDFANNGTNDFFIHNNVANTNPISINASDVVTMGNLVVSGCTGCGSGGAVSSVFGRTGGVVGVSGDYTAALVTNAASTASANTFGAFTQTFGGPLLSSGTANVMGSFISSATNGTTIQLKNTSSGGHDYQFFSGGSASSPGYFGVYDNTAVKTPFAISGGSGLVAMSSAVIIGWSTDSSFAAGAPINVGLGTMSTGAEVNNGTAGTLRDIATRHYIAGGTSPSISSGFGTTPAIAGKDSGGRITVGSGGSATVGVITFGTAFSNAPACVANDENTILLVQATSSTTTLTLTSSSAWTAADKLTWNCLGY